ncbi:hypothetical protein C4K04_6540 [Pseudomonas chlororaphis]|uniref:ABM domain-containing protein n=1 Tax=Pseudomonas chlororaphis TaxID=587753 RepID=A0A3G7U0I2_9PSED|nr:putative quinol monooxygenase [Pseudomonas chlororaphis]AZE52168.1 hypothetical protein C4K04_6540 [Pseudomonas chlororaphis]
MNSKQIIVVAFPTASPGKEDELIARFRTLLEASRQEPGCIDFHFHQHQQSTNRFVVYESFTDQAAFDAHLSAPHTQEFIAYLRESGASLDYEFWSMLSHRPNATTRMNSLDKGERVATDVAMKEANHESL